MTGYRSANQVEIRTFDPGTENDIIKIVNAYTASWPYSRPVDASVLAYWRTMGDRFQPHHMLLAYHNGAPKAFLHGEWTEEWFDVYLLAAMPGAVDEATQLLHAVEPMAKSAGSPRIDGPTHRAWRFYNGYALGHEPYHPHWERDATEAYVRSGWCLSYASVMMVADLSREVAISSFPKGYVLTETRADEEFSARVFRFAATYNDEEVASCLGRHFEKLAAPGGGSVGQLGFVGTDEAHRNRGLARRLVECSLKRLKEWGASECLLVTGLDNIPALRAYENAGFERRYSLNKWSKDFPTA